MSSQPTSNCGDHKPWLAQPVPALDWLRHYERKHLPGDALAGVISHDEQYEAYDTSD